MKKISPSNTHKRSNNSYHHLDKGGKICDNRYIIALVFLVLVVSLRLNGGSLTRVRYALGVEENGDPITEIFGFPRDIRSDEWASQSLYNISQSKEIS